MTSNLYYRLYCTNITCINVIRDYNPHLKSNIESKKLQKKKKKKKEKEICVNKDEISVEKKLIFNTLTCTIHV